MQRIRDLARQTAGYAASDIMEERRQLWTRHNSMRPGRPLFHVRSIPVQQVIDGSEYRCTDSYLRKLEQTFLLNQYRMKLADDTIIEPFLTVRAAVKINPEGIWGLPAQLGEAPAKFGAAAYAPSIIEESDIERLHVADYEIDEQETALRYEQLADVLGDIIDVDVDRQGALCAMWCLDISTLLAQMRGLEQIMWDIYDRPEWLHKVLAFMRDHILKHMDQTEAAGGFSLINHVNQTMPYCEELAPPKAGVHGVKPSELWGFCASQETTTFGAEHFDEFMLQYQIPIIERFGLSAYGCCEDLTHKIDLLRRIKNLRRIAVTPWSNIRRCAEQIGKDYIVSWRPNPSSAVSHGVDESFVRNELQQAFDIFDANGCMFDINLKDVETVSGDAGALIRWCQIVRDEIEKRY